MPGWVTAGINKQWLSSLPVVKPSEWELLRYSHCDGTRQSPINIEKVNAVVDEHLNAFNFKKFDDKHVIEHIINTGHTGF